MSKVMRSVKNVTKGYSSVQVKVRNATSNDPWGPTGTEMSEISQMTFNSSNEFYEIMDMLDKRLNDKGKNWRHVLKALKVLDYCLHEGSELVVTWAHKNLYIIKTLREFQYIDEDGRDVGQNIRVSAKELTSLILDEERLRAERSDRKNWKSRVTGIEEYGSPSNDIPRRQPRPQRAQRADEEDAEYRLAIEASKYQEEEDRKKRQSKHGEPDDDDLAKAIKLSKEEEELRRRELEDQNAQSLFDDDPIQVAQPTGFNQGYQQQGAVDWSGNPIDSGMQQQPTGFYSQPTGFQPQPTGYQNGFSNGFGAQPTGFDPYGQQQPQQFQPQQTGFNPYQQTSSPFQQQPQEVPPMPTGTNNPWATNQQTQVQALQPMKTGSNNPFASSFARPQTAQPAKPTLATLQEQKTLSHFNSISNFNNQPAQPAQPPKPQNEHEARLNALLANGDGMDTFGNTGNLRIPAQHTAPGTFVNSAGAGLNKLHSQQTGTNPFLQTQFTGMPQTSYGGNTSGFGAAGHQMPAATGPAGMANGFGGGYGAQQSSNPFGARPQQQNGGGDLIQF
ncbi:ENTH-domain-containing protein [Coleophoma cylindrospora]|uniref:ENTH-domain-containing protein n=1 Tax=Coleophoma cylindrospora TaxID=1849047 RepID=A0A3D8SR86_9HELO|nr:ENTH-domain-containing protein [Coleophoma cylindrospora]